MRLRLRGERYSTKTLPLMWSISCWMHTAIRPSASITRLLPFSSSARTRTWVARSTPSYMPGTERQPSSRVWRSSLSHSISGLISTTRWSRVSETSITTTRWCTSTWVAAKPTPLASYMVSNISFTSVRMASSTASTGRATMCSLGSGYTRMGSRAIRNSKIREIHGAYLGAWCKQAARREK